MKLFIQLILTVLLLVSLGAGVISALWHWAPERVQRFEHSVKIQYLQEPREELIRLTAVARKSPKAALGEIEALVDSLEPHPRGDRLFQTRLMANRLLVTTLLRMKKTEAGLAIARELASFDEFHHINRRWVARQFVDAGMPYINEGLGMYRELFEAFPEDPALARLTTATLEKIGDLAGALEATLLHLEAVPDGKSYEQVDSPWSYSVATLEKELVSAPKVRLEVTMNRTYLLLKIELAPEVHFLRLSPPVMSTAAFGEPIVVITVGKETQYKGSLGGLAPKLEKLVLDEHGLVLHGHLYPHITMELPKLDASTGPETSRLIRIGFPIGRFPRWTESQLVTEMGAARVDDIRRASGSSLRAKFLAERVLNTRAYAIAAQGLRARVDEDEVTPIPLKVVNSPRLGPSTEPASPHDLTFAFERSVTGEAGSLDLELPPIVGLTIQLQEVSWTGPDGQALIAAAPVALDASELAPVPGDSNRWRVLPGATKPSLRWILPQAPGVTLKITGGLR